MKLTALAFILLLSSNIYMVNGQAPSKQLDEATKLKMEKLRMLEGQLDEMRAVASVGLRWEIKVTGKDPASLTLTIKASGGASGKTEPFSVSLKEADIPDEYVDEAMKQLLLKNTKCGSLDAVWIAQVGVTNDYMVMKDYSYGPPHANYTIKVSRGTVYDRASIPRVIWFISKDMVGNVAPLIHDLLYRNGGKLPAPNISPYRRFSRKEADQLFLKIMKQCDVGLVTREAAYVAVRKFSWFAWKKPSNN